MTTINLSEITDDMFVDSWFTDVKIDDQELLQAIKEYQKAKIMEDNAKYLKDKAEEVIKNRLIDKNIDRAFIDDNNIIKISHVTRTIFDSKTFKKKNLPLYKQYQKLSKFDRITVEHIQ